MLWDVLFFDRLPLEFFIHFMLCLTLLGTIFHTDDHVASQLKWDCTHIIRVVEKLLIILGKCMPIIVVFLRWKVFRHSFCVHIFLVYIGNFLLTNVFMFPG
jgi:hypothetical protein